MALLRQPVLPSKIPVLSEAGTNGKPHGFSGGASCVELVDSSPGQLATGRSVKSKKPRLGGD
jgi:hypothetical protein